MSSQAVCCSTGPRLTLADPRIAGERHSGATRERTCFCTTAVVHRQERWRGLSDHRRAAGDGARLAQAHRCGRCPRGSYLLGLYLGDGCLSLHRRGVYRLRVSLDASQPLVVSTCSDAMAAVARGRRVGCLAGRGCLVVNAYWKHWPCLLPQHAPGRKHSRRIALLGWQREILAEEPEALLRGFIHSDGSRTLNRVGGSVYPRYEFSNRSADILQIFCQTCDNLGVHWTRPAPTKVSIARRTDVARLDAWGCAKW